MPTFTITGRVVDTKGVLQTGLWITAFDQASFGGIGLIRDEDTSLSGTYTLTWTQDLPLCLRVVATVGGPAGAVVARSRYIFDPKDRSRLRIDLVVDDESIAGGPERYVGKTEYERIKAGIDAVTASAPESVTAETLEWVCGKADLYPPYVAIYVQASKLSAIHGVDPKAFYGMGRCGLSLRLAQLLGAGETQWRASLQAAYDTLIIPGPSPGSPESPEEAIADEIDGFVADLKVLEIDAALATSSGRSMKAILDPTGFSPTKQRTFLEQWQLNTGTTEEFWTELEAHPEFDAADVATLQFVLEGAALIRHHYPALEGLTDLRTSLEISLIKDLASWTVSDWEDFLESGTPTIGAPDDIPGTTQAEKITAFATMLERSVALRYPTPLLARRLETAAPPGITGVVAFFDGQQAFKAESTILERYIAENSLSLDPTHVANIKKVQRLHAVAPHWAKDQGTIALLSAGYTSARDIVMKGKVDFVAELAPALENVLEGVSGADMAGSMFARASAKYGAAVILMHNFFAETQGGGGGVGLPPPDDFGGGAGIATLQTLFGSLDYCDCPHCRSVYSPAAYLVDLLNFAKHTSAGGDPFDSAIEALLARRPDLADLELSCENTNTVLPYIDLVNEILETAIAQSPELSYQTTWSSAELLVTPEHENPAPYDGVLDEAVYPWTLPYERWDEEVRIYLEHLSVPRHELMRVLQTSAGSPSDNDIGRESLGITATLAGWIGGTNPTGGAAAFWDLPNVLNWSAPLQQVKELLARSGLSYTELTEIIELEYVRSGYSPGSVVPLEIVFDDGSSPPIASCNLDDATIPLLDDTIAARMHRFVRLWRLVKIRPRELDLAMKVLANDLSVTGVGDLGLAESLRARTRLSPFEQLSWWDDIDTRTYHDGEACLYDQLFQNRMVTFPLDEDFELEALADTIGDEQIPTVIAALRISEADLRLLMASPYCNDERKLPNLSALHRHASLARAIRLSIPDLLVVRSWLGEPPFSPVTEDIFSSPSASTRFVDLIELIRGSGFTIDEIDYLVRDIINPYHPAAPDDEQIDLALETLAEGLSKAVVDVLVLDDPTGTFVAQHLGQIFDDVDTVDDIMTLLEKTSSWNSDDITLVLQHFPEFIVDPESATSPMQEAVAMLVGDPGAPEPIPPTLTDARERYEYTSRRILSYLARVDVLDQTLSTSLSIERDAVHQLVFEILLLSASPLAFLRDVFLADDFDGNDAEDVRSWKLLLKAGLLIRKFKIPADELRWFFTTDSLLWFELNDLPVGDVPTSAEIQALFAAWTDLAYELDLRRSFKTNGNLHADIVEAGSIGAAMQILADGSGWSVEDLLYLAGIDGFNASYPADFQGHHALRRIRDAVQRIRRLGIAANTAWSWAHDAPSQDQSHAVRRAAKAKYDDARWAEVAHPLHERLREQRRRALLAYLIANSTAPAFANSTEVYAHFLIDPEMAGCMLTSRIKQAIASVQLFVQRCLLNLEPDITIVPDKAPEWAWMKTYRVWEANRKVFLYPENWVEPELRDDKTPLFVELEADLRKAELTPIAAEDAFKSYLIKLHTVSDLDVVGFYHQKKDWQNTDETDDIVHVIGRTKAPPSRYFYRKRLAGTGWTAWEEIPLQIEGDNVCPVIHNRRLFLFWVTLLEEEVKPTRQEVDDEELEPDERRNVFLRPIVYWSEFWNGAWTRHRSVKGPSYMKTHAEAVNEYDDMEQQRAVFVKAYRGGYFQEDDALWVELSRVAHSRYGEGSEYQLHPTLGQTDIWGRFRYDDCQDALIPYPAPDQDDQGGGYSGQELAAPSGAQVSSQRFRAPIPVIVFQPTVQNNNGSLTPCPVFGHTPLGYFVTYSHSHTFPAQFGRKLPRFFYADKDHTLYAVQTQVTIPTAGGTSPLSPDTDDSFLRGGITATGLAPSTTLATFAPEIRKKLDETETPIVWGGQIPGAKAVLIAAGAAQGTDVVRSNSTLAVLGHAVELVELGTALQDGENAYPGGSGKVTGFRFFEFHHPFICMFLERLNRVGIDGLLAPPVGDELKRQAHTEPYMEDDYLPQHVAEPYPIDEIDTAAGSAYGTYNWELFYHAPLLIAKRLTTEQRFEEAMRWYHYIFNPLDTSDEVAPARFWNFKEFYNDAKGGPLSWLRVVLGYDGTPAEQADARQEFADQVFAWRKSPFKPHLLARLRAGAYERATVMGYLDNLIAWGDSLFRQDTIETINEATQIYLLASTILGERPVRLPEHSVQARTWAELDATGLDPFSNALVELEGWLVTGQDAEGQGVDDETPADEGAAFETPPVMGWYFCYPPNDRLVAYWDTVADRLFKIRNCMNIEGVVRQLPLFEPPIDPALLVKAVAAGVDIASAIQGLNAPVPRYRFAAVHQRAMEFAGEVRALGAALLAALEKRDGETLALLRSTQERHLLEAIADVRRVQIREAKEAISALEASKSAPARRFLHYSQLLSDGLSGGERENLNLLAKGRALTIVGQSISLVGNLLRLIPEFAAGWSGIGPLLKFEFGGANLGNAMDLAGQAVTISAGAVKEEAAIVSINAGYGRRSQDWTIQMQTAQDEMNAIDRQIIAAQVRLEIAEKELENQLLQIDNSKAVDDFMRSKYTNEQLYDWTISQTAELHFRAYQLAFEMAKRAERAYRFELGLDDSSFITAGYWDSLRKGLYAGERLQLDLRRMDAAYLDLNKREYELTKSIPLSQLDPAALVQLREEGDCAFDVPEVIFDLDHPGHYMRRIKSVSVTIPAVAGPYTTVGAKLTLMSDSVRATKDLVGSQYRRQPGDDSRFRDHQGAIKSIATSSGQNDAGLFELNFRDERYLPFEGAGVISSWELELPTALRQFDYRTISDVVLHFSYTARDGGTSLKEQVDTELIELVNGSTSPVASGQDLVRLFSARSEFADEWNAFLFPAAPVEEQADLSMVLDLTAERFPFAFQRDDLMIDRVQLVLVLAPGTSYTGGNDLELDLTPSPTDPTNPVQLTLPGTGSLVPSNSVTYVSAETVGTWTIVVHRAALSTVHSGIVLAPSADRLDPDRVQDLLLLVHYRLPAPPP